MVYTLDEICQMKCAAYLARDTLRDLYDLVYICTNYMDCLSDATKGLLANAFAYKDLDQFDYLVEASDEDDIDTDDLETRLLEMYDMLGLEAGKSTAEDVSEKSCVSSDEWTRLQR